MFLGYILGKLVFGKNWERSQLTYMIIHFGETERVICNQVGMRFIGRSFFQPCITM
jgi:hypothetical protein